MKKMLFLSLVAVAAVLSSSAQNYPNYPPPAPQAYPQNGGYPQQSQADQYYYYPDANVYYYPYTNNYIYYDQNRWCQASYLPDYMRFNNQAPRVLINYRGRSIWDLNNDHVSRYRSNNGGYYNNGYGGYNNREVYREERRMAPQHYPDNGRYGGYQRGYSRH